MDIWIAIDPAMQRKKTEGLGRLAKFAVNDLGGALQSKKEFQTTFARLKRVLQKYEKHLTVKANTASNYYLDAGYSEKFKKEIFFGAVTIKKNYVSFYLMPVYAFPDLLKEISPTLKKRMQGKSCFNFTTIDDHALRELTALTEKGVARYRKENFAPVKRAQK